MKNNRCEYELNAVLPDGWTGTIEINEKLDVDYAFNVCDTVVEVRASRWRNAWCALGDVESTVRSGRKLASKHVKSPLTVRMVEAWAPMHDHMFLPLPEYHEHSWHIRLRPETLLEMDEQAVEVAVTRYQRYLELIAKQGYTHVVLDDPEYLALFPNHPEIYPKDGHFYRRHLVYRSLFRKLVDIAAGYDLEFVLFCQEVGYTPPMQAFFGELCPQNETMWALMMEKYVEIMDAFPEIGGYMFKMSDAFPAPDGLYHHRDLFTHECPACGGSTPLARVKMFVDKIYRCVVQEHGKKLYYRTWDVGHGIHVNIEKHRELFGGINDARVFPLLKYTRGDFQLSNPPHPGIGGMANQVVEYQFKPEHDGHGVLPLYLGDLHQRSLRENLEKGIAGVWTWPSGGGRSSINYITHFKGFTRFAELNQFVFSRGMMEPQVSHQEFLTMWGDMELGASNGGTLGGILSDLMEAFQLMCNFGVLWTGEREYAKSSFHHGWFFDWHSFRHGNSRMERGEEVICTRVLPHISDIEAAIARMHRSADLFARGRQAYEQEIVMLPGYEHEYHAFHSAFLGAEAFAHLSALWVEALLRFYGTSYERDAMRSLIAQLESARRTYDRNYGLFVTQCMDYFIPRVKSALEE